MARRADNLAWLYDGLRAADTLVAKTLGVSEQAQSAKIEVRLREFVTAQWNALAGQATRTAAGLIRNGPGGEVRAGDVDAALAAVDRTMNQWPGRVTERFARDQREVYQLGRESGLKKALGVKEGELTYNTPSANPEIKTVEKAETKNLTAFVKPSFDLVDQEALSALEDHQAYWIGTHYDENVSNVVASGAKEQIKAGMGRTEAGKKMEQIVKDTLQKVQTPTGFNGTARQYFEGLVANASTVSRTTGHLRSFEKIGFNVYVVVNPSDHRTCEICNLMDGKEFRTADGMALSQSVVGAKSPMDVKKHHPWLTPAKARSLAGKPGPASPKQTEALAKAGHSMPTYHYRCRCDIDIADGAQIIQFETDIGGGVPPAKPLYNPSLKIPKAAQLKPAKAPKPKPAKKPPTPPPAPGQSAKVADVAPDVSQAVRASEFPWEARELKRLQKTFNGAHRKWAYRAPDGTDWLFKPYSRAEAFRAYGDEAAYKLGFKLRVSAARTHVVEIDGEIGSIQRLYKNVSGDLKAGGGVPIESLTERQLGQIQREHAFDWLIGNHDGHGGNLLATTNGNVVGIDKGQLFKFYGKDSIATTYNPNQRFGEISYYNQQFDRYAKSRIPAFELTVQNKELQAFLKNVDELADEDFLALIRPYSSRASKAKLGPFERWSEQRFLDEALKRKRELRRTMEKFYDDLAKARGKALPAVEEVAEAAPGKAFTPIDAKFVKQARGSDWAGKAVFVAGEDYESMQFLTYGRSGSTILESKLRTAGDRKFLAFVKRAIGEEEEHFDEYWERVLKYTKSLNSHMGPGGDGVLPAHTKELGKQLADMFLQTSEELVVADKLAEFRHYKKEIGKLMTAAGNAKKSGVGKKIAQYSPAAKKVGNLPAGAPKVRKVTYFNEGEKTLRNGKIVQTGTGAGERFAGEVYEVDFGGGVTMEYVRHGDGNKFSKHGKVRIVINKSIEKATAKDIDNALKQMERLGLGTKLADKDDIELLYLIKVTRAAGLEGKPGFSPIPDAPVKDNIKLLKTAWEKKLKKKLTKAAGYEPLPEAEFLDGSGWGRFKRFDIDVEKLVKDDVGLYHSLYGGADDLKVILEGKTGALISTEEKYRMGIVPKGMSPGQDQSTGGASYVFTRLRTSENALAEIRFHPELLRDPDAIMYRSDMFGKVHEETIKAKRQYGQAKMTSIARGRMSNNETIFKNTISLEKWLDEVRVYNEARREKAIGWFKDAGITHVGPNRKRIEDAIVVTRTKLR